MGKTVDKTGKYEVVERKSKSGWIIPLVAGGVLVYFEFHILLVVGCALMAAGLWRATR